MIQRNKVKCSICGREISKSNITKHEAACNGIIKEINYSLMHEGLECQFCGKTCKNKNSLCNHERLCKLNPNRQQGVGFTAFNEARKNGLTQSWNKGLNAETDERVAKFSESLKSYYENNPGFWTGKKLPEEMKKKIGQGVKQYLIENPDMVPYKRNHSSKESYPEHYFSEYFKTNNIEVIEQYSIHSYHLDFCNIEKKIDIEIDGEQHYVDHKIVAHDEKRNAYLQSLGWTIFRVRWSEYQKMSDESKADLLLKIKELLQ